MDNNEEYPVTGAIYTLRKMAERKHNTCSNSDPDLNVEGICFYILHLKTGGIKDCPIEFI
jgi:hypothetical protein